MEFFRHLWTAAYNLTADQRRVFVKRAAWVADVADPDQRPRLLGEDYFANGINPFDYAYFGGEAAFQGKAQARPAAGVIYRMLTQGYRWAGYAAWHFWMSQNEATDQYAPNAPRAAFVREWDWTFGSGQPVPRTIGLFNDTRFDDPMTFTWTLVVDGKELATQTSEHRVPPGENEKFAITLPLPAVKARTEGELRLVLRVKGQEVFRDTKPLSVLAISPGSRHDLALAVLDPQQKLAAFLQAQRIVFTAVTNLVSLPEAARVLLVGPDALSAGEATSSRLAAWASAGRRVIVLDQTHPLQFHGLPCEMNAEQNTGRTAFIEDTEHPAVRGLSNRDFFTWSGDEIVYRNAYQKPTRGAKSLIQCHRRLKNSALVEVPVGSGLMLLSQLDLGAKLATNAVAQTLLLNLLDYAADYQLEFRPVAAAVATDPLLAQTVEAIGLANTPAADARAALAMPKAKILLIHASPANLKQLADSAAPVQAFLNAGGFIVLNGLTPEGLADYNRLVGFEHLIRPFWRERIALASPRHPLTAGLSTGDVVFRSGERIFGWTSDEFVADDVFSYIVDYRDVAPFARFENDFKKLMVNGMVNADAWKYIVNLPVEQCVFKLVWPRPQTFESLTWIGNQNYLLARQAEFQFDGGQKATFDFAPNDEPQDFEIKPPRPASEIVFKITKWDEKPDTHALSGLEAEQHIFIIFCAVRAHGIEILARRVFEKSDPPGERRVLDMLIEHRKKNGDAPAFAAQEFRLGGGVNRVHLAMAGRQHEVFAGRHGRIGIAEKIKGEQHKQHPERHQGAGQGDHEAADEFGHERHHDQCQHRSAGQADELQGGFRRFARVFHRGTIKFFAATCNSAFWAIAVTGTGPGGFKQNSVRNPARRTIGANRASHRRPVGSVFRPSTLRGVAIY